jgi:spermidine synthase
MPHPHETIASVETKDGKLELLRLYAGDWIIMQDQYALMSSRQRKSELALAEMACAPLAKRTAPRVLVAGLGMGYTLRAALDVLPPDAEVVTAELNETVVAWNQEHLADLAGRPLDDPRVRLEVTDVSLLIRQASGAKLPKQYDAIVLDLYEGPYPGTAESVFGHEALERARMALRPDGCLAIWSEGSVAKFERLLRKCGFRVQEHRPKHKGPRHVVYLAWPRRA